MARPAQITPADISLRLQSGGAATAQRLAEALNVDRSTIARGLARMGDRVVVLGAARRARNAFRPQVRAAGDRWPMYRIDSVGRAAEWGRLQALHGGWLIEWAHDRPAWAEFLVDREGFTDRFPFFLGDMRPQGFLGRGIARGAAETLRLPGDPRQWGDDDTMVYLQAMGNDMPGDLVVGEGPLRAILSAQWEQPEDDLVFDEPACQRRYPELAVRAMAGESTGSSAGGEQPKFLAALREAGGAVRRVLVKFSPPTENETGRRWADLLVAEAQALWLLAEHSLAMAGVRVIDAGGRRFLEVTRHDRVGAHGRRGVVSLEALHAALAPGAAYNWPAAAVALESAALIDRPAREQIQKLHAFGELIGNTDMHHGNFSFWCDDCRPFRPAPAYDMLPMAWAPVRFGELVAADQPLAPRPPLPEEIAAWSEAAGWAVEYWRRVGNDDRVSPDFARRAQAAGEHVARMRAHFAP